VESEEHKEPEDVLGDEKAQEAIRKAVAAGLVDNDALGELLDIAREQAKAEVNVRGELNNRAGWLLGFAGVILTLAGAQAQKVLSEAAALGSIDRPLAVVFLAVAVIAVGLAAYFALQILRLRPAVQISSKQLTAMSRSSAIKGPQAYVRGAMLKNIAEETVEDRGANDTRRMWLKRASFALVVAAVFLVLHVGVFLERAYEDKCSEPTRVELLRIGAPASAPSRLPAMLTAEGLVPTPASELGVAHVVADEPPIEFDFGCFGKGKTET
jgi:uncharacterized membrane protein (DUF485 family)